MPAPPRTAEAAAVEWSAPSRAWRILVDMKRDELVTPVQAIIDVSDHVLGDPKALEQPRFAEDIRRMRSAALDLRGMVQDVLAAVKLEAVASEAEFDALRARIRHDMLNKLNPVINYSEMWLEDAAEFFLQGFIPDLELLHGMGKRCYALIDTIMESWNIETSLTPGAAPDLARIQEMVQRITSQQPEGPHETGRLLIVDDNEVNRDILRRLLESQGHQVSAAANGRQALEMLAAEDFDLVLLDIVMPEMDGFDVLTRLKANTRLRNLPVIMISALNEVEYAVSCIRLGAEDYLNRPYNAVFLKARIGACLEKKRLRERETEHLCLIEHERRRADELLHVILPSQFVTELKETQTVVPRRYDGVAVLFADIVAFTPYCEKHPPETVVRQLQHLVELWEEVALKYEIQKIKTIGDAFMAACGLLTPVENPVLNCIRFGSEMIAATQALPTGWNLRVGIHFGQVVGAVLGRRQYLFDLFGDTVNTAARMESHGLCGAIVLSSDAWSQVAHLCAGTELDPTAVKGKGIVPRFRFDGFA